MEVKKIELETPEWADDIIDYLESSDYLESEKSFISNVVLPRYGKQLVEVVDDTNAFIITPVNKLNTCLSGMFKEFVKYIIKRNFNNYGILITHELVLHYSDISDKNDLYANYTIRIYTDASSSDYIGTETILIRKNQETKYVVYKVR